MNELGEEEKNLHEMIGEIIPKYTDMLITVGNLASIFAEKSLEKGLDSKQVYSLKMQKKLQNF